MTPEYPLLEFLFITPNNSKQTQNACIRICCYIFWQFSLSLHKTQSWLDRVHVNSGPKAFIFAPRLKETYSGVIEKQD